MQRIHLALISVFLCALAATGQTPSDAAFLQQSAALRSKLAAWETILSKMNFAASPPVNIRGETLEVRRHFCQVLISVVSRESEARGEMPAIPIQLLFLSDLSSLANALGSFEQLLQLSLQMHSPGNSASGVEMEQEQQVEEMQKQLQESYAGLSAETFARLRALDQERAEPDHSLSGQPGRVAGHVYNADTGQPLAGVTVTLEAPQFAGSDKLQHTAADGGYQFADLAPEKYWVIAYRSGFVGSIYGMDASQNVWASAIDLKSGQKLENADLRLSPLPRITAMNEPMPEPSPGSEHHIVYGPGRFSPDGLQFSLVGSEHESTFVCVYNVPSHKPDYVANMPAHLRAMLSIADLPWVGDSPYAIAMRDGIGTSPLKITRNGIQRLDVQPECADLPRGRPCFVSKDAPPLPPIPPEVQVSYWRSLSRLLGTQTNQHFVVTANGFPNQPVQLAAQRKDGQDPYLIATGGKELKTYLLDPSRPVVFYPVPGLYLGALVAINLETRQSLRVALPFAQGLRLLDMYRDAERTVVAYTVDGPCLPQEMPTGENPWILPNRAAPPAQAANVCFAEIADITGLPASNQRVYPR